MFCEVCKRTSEETTVTYCTKYGGYLCSKHRHHIDRYGEIKTIEKKIVYCDVCGIDNTNAKVHWCSAAQKMLCLKHRDQYVRCGHILESTKRDRNAYVRDGAYVLIPLKCADGAVYNAVIDREDEEKCRPYKWFVTEKMGNTRYVNGIVGKKKISLHRFILGYTGDLFVDHIDRNGLNNTKENLRIVSISENCVNSKTRSACGHKNIYQKNGKYQVCIKRNYKTVFTKTFCTLEEAVSARDAFLRKYNSENNRCA